MTLYPRRRVLQAGIVAISAACLRSGTAADELDEQTLNQRIDASIRRAVTWLANDQLPSGAWTTKNWGESTATTSLAVMALLAAGHVPDEGPFGRHLTRGVGWLLSQQNEQGMFIGKKHGHGPMYSHGISTLMLAEVIGMVNSDQADDCRVALEKAVRLIIDAQNHPKPAQYDGGWRYNPRDMDADLSVTAWQLLALRAARDIGCDVPSENIDRAIAYVKRLHVLRDGGFGYMAGDESTVTRTGTGITALEVCGEHRTEETLSAARLLLSKPLNSLDHYFFYGAYYCTIGMYKVGGAEWQQARKPLYQTILNLQNPGGYWTPSDGTEQGAGKVYATALSVLALAIEYGYLPIYQR